MLLSCPGHVWRQRTIRLAAKSILRQSARALFSADDFFEVRLARIHEKFTFSSLQANLEFRVPPGCGRFAAFRHQTDGSESADKRRELADSLLRTYAACASVDQFRDRLVQIRAAKQNQRSLNPPYQGHGICWYL